MWGDKHEWGSQVGDIVGRRSYNSDTMFRIEKIVGDTAYLKGIFFRLTADAPISDLEIISREEFLNTLL